MKLRLLAVGQRMPGWIAEGFEDYNRRLPPHLRLRLEEIAPGQRAGGDVLRAMRQEAQAIARRVGEREFLVALDQRGESWSTEQLAERLQRWQQGHEKVCLLVGGPDGLHADSLTRADRRWSLGPLTLPHPLVRVIVAEQVYRAWTLLSGHPYHRA